MDISNRHKGSQGPVFEAHSTRTGAEVHLPAESETQTGPNLTNQNPGKSDHFQAQNPPHKTMHSHADAVVNAARGLAGAGRAASGVTMRSGSSIPIRPSAARRASSRAISQRLSEPSSSDSDSGSRSSADIDISHTSAATSSDSRSHLADLRRQAYLSKASPKTTYLDAIKRQEHNKEVKASTLVAAQNIRLPGDKSLNRVSETKVQDFNKNAYRFLVPPANMVSHTILPTGDYVPEGIQIFNRVGWRSHGHLEIESEKHVELKNIDILAHIQTQGTSKTDFGIRAYIYIHNFHPDDHTESRNAGDVLMIDQPRGLVAAFGSNGVLKTARLGKPEAAIAYLQKEKLKDMQRNESFKFLEKNDA